MRGVRPRAVPPFTPNLAVAAPVAAQRLDVGFTQKAVILEVFHRGNRCHRFGQTIGVTGVTYKYVRIK